MYKVQSGDLEDITNLLDAVVAINPKTIEQDKLLKIKAKAQKLSYMVKTKYTQIKPEYDTTG